MSENIIVSLVEKSSCKLFIQWLNRNSTLFLLTVPRRCFFLWNVFVINVSCLSCFLVCSFQPCGHLLGKGLTLSSVVCDVVLCFVTFTCVVLGQGWNLIVSIPDLCLLTYFEK